MSRPSLLRMDLAALSLMGGAVPVRVSTHPRARRMALRIDPQGEAVDLVLPPRGSLPRALEFFEANRRWLERRLAALPPRTELRRRRDRADARRAASHPPCRGQQRPRRRVDRRRGDPASPATRRISRGACATICASGRKRELLRARAPARRGDRAQGRARQRARHAHALGKLRGDRAICASRGASSSRPRR